MVGQSKKLSFFPEILAGPGNGFAQCLECLALNKSSNNKFSGIFNVNFRFEGLKSDSFRDINELNFLDKSSDSVNHKDLDASVDKIQKFKTRMEQMK